MRKVAGAYLVEVQDNVQLGDRGEKVIQDLNEQVDGLQRR